MQNFKEKKAALPIFKPWINYEAMQSQSWEEMSKTKPHDFFAWQN